MLISGLKGLSWPKRGMVFRIFYLEQVILFHNLMTQSVCWEFNHQKVFNRVCTIVLQCIVLTLSFPRSKR